MNVWIASDIHGSALYCRQLLDLMERQGGDRLVLLGDLLYHGPATTCPGSTIPKSDGHSERPENTGAGCARQLRR